LYLFDLQIQLTGKLGKRTIYQERDIAQLAINIESRTVKLDINPVNSIYTTI